MFANVEILNRIAQAITVADICAPFIGTYGPSDRGDVVREDWDSKVGHTRDETPLDHIGLVSKDGVPVGTIGYEDLEDHRSIWASMNKLSWKTVVSADTALVEAAKLFSAHSPYVFLVLRQNQLIGWMSYHHLLGIPFRACLFSLLLGIEQAMLDVVTTDRALAVSNLPAGRLKKAKEVYLARGHKLDKNGAADPRLLLECTNFIDKATIIQKCPSTAANITAVSDKAMKKAERIRNSLAHPARERELVMLLSKDEIHSFLAWADNMQRELLEFTNSHSRLTA